MREGVRLGVDVGTVRVGVATCDPRGVLATPVCTLPRDGGAGPDDVSGLVALVAEHAPLEVVIGLPRSLDGTEGPAAAAVRDYARLVAAGIAPVVVRLVDERLTTVDAHRGLRDSGVRGRAHRAVVDQAAAVLILQSALDAERASGAPPGEELGRKRRKPRTKDRTG